MKSNKRRAISAGKSFSALQITTALSLACLSANAIAKVEFHPSLAVNATWIDNIDLATEGNAKTSDYVFQVTPGFTFLQKAARFNSSVNYTMQNFFYGSDSDRNSTFHQLTAEATAEAIRDYFFIAGNGSYSQEIIDPSQPTNNSLLFATGNVANTLAGQLSPYFHHAFESFLADVRYSRGVVRYKTATSNSLALQDVNTEESHAKFGSVDDQARLTWEARYDRQTATYQTAAPFRFDSASLELGLLVGKSFRLLGRGGSESDVALDTSKGGLDQTWWEAGFRWQPTLRSEVEALYGKHFYGKTYNVKIRHEARLVEFLASYTEGPTTQAQELVLRPVAQPQNTQPGQNPLTPFVPGSDNAGRITSQVYLQKYLDARITIKGQRTSINFTGFDYRRDYNYFAAAEDISLTTANGIEHTSGGGIGIDRKISATIDFNLNGKLTDTSVVDTTAPYDYREVFYNLGFSKTLSKKIQLSLLANRLRRTGTTDYAVDWVTLGVVGTF